MASRDRRRGAGLTESIVLTGLIALLLLAAVRRFSHQIDVTFRGSAGATEDLGKASFDGARPRRSSKGPDGRFHATDEQGKAISAPDVGGEPGRWVYER